MTSYSSKGNACTGGTLITEHPLATSPIVLIVEDHEDALRPLNESITVAEGLLLPCIGDTVVMSPHSYFNCFDAREFLVSETPP